MALGLEDFVGKLVEEKGLGHLDPEVLTQLKKDLLGRLEDRVNAIVLAKMPPEKLEEFEKLVDAGNEEKIQVFCSENIPNLDQSIAAELLAFRQTYLG